MLLMQRRYRFATNFKVKSQILYKWDYGTLFHFHNISRRWKLLMLQFFVITYDKQICYSLLMWSKSLICKKIITLVTLVSFDKMNWFYFSKWFMYKQINYILKVGKIKKRKNKLFSKLFSNFLCTFDSKYLIVNWETISVTWKMFIWSLFLILTNLLDTIPSKREIFLNTTIN